MGRGPPLCRMTRDDCVPGESQMDGVILSKTGVIDRGGSILSPFFYGLKSARTAV